MRLIANFSRDVRLAVRMLRRNPAFALVTVVTLALPLGANTAVFSLVDEILIASLPVRDPEQLVVLSRSHLEERGSPRFTYQLFRDLASGSDLFDGLLSRVGGLERVTVGTESGGEPAMGELVSGSYYEVLGVKPFVGRLLVSSDDVTPGGHPVVVLSYSYWQRRFGSDPGVVGRPIRVTGTTMTVVGVSPPGFDGLDPAQTVDLRFPLAMTSEVRAGTPSRARSNSAELNIIGRLRRHVPVERARAVVTARLQQYLAQHEPASGAGSRLLTNERIDLLPAANGFGATRRQYQTSLRTLWFVTSALLLIACFNLANLLLVRANARMREFAVRRAVGAGTSRLAAQLLTEAAVVSLCGMVLGAVLAFLGLPLLTRFMVSEATASRLSLDISPRIALFHLGTSTLAIVLLAVAPALAAGRTGLSEALKTGRSGDRSAAGRKVFLVLQIALSLVVLVGAMLFVRTVHALRATDLGFRSDGLLMLAMSPKNAGRLDEQVLPFFRAARERVSQLPGVESATYSMVRPLLNVALRAPVVVSGCCLPDGATPSRNVVGPRYFETLGIPVLEGRDFTEQDNTSAPKVAIVNESFARLFGSGRDVIGMRIGANAAEYSIVGIVRDSRYVHIREAPAPAWFIPYEQAPMVKYLDLYVRTTGDPDRIRESVRQAIAAVDSDVALFEVRSLSAHIDNLLIAERSVASLATFFGLIAAALATLGLYGLLTFQLTQRRREIAIRTALGAQPGMIARLVIAELVPAIAGGILVGFVLAGALARYSATLLYGVAPLDPASLAVAVILLGSLAAIAAALPARRAARVEPAESLKAEV